MKKRLFILLIALSITVSTNFLSAEEIDNNSTQEQNKTNQVDKILTIHLDIELKKVKQQTQRGQEHHIIDRVIFIEDNEKIIFSGTILEQNSPISIKISRIIEDDQDNDEVSFIGKQYTISTSELHDGNHIIMKDKKGKIFLNQIIRKE